MADFSNIIEIRKRYKENANNIRNGLTVNHKILPNEDNYKMFLISRNMLGFSMTHGLIFNKFNEKKLNIQKKISKKYYFLKWKIYYKSNPNNILKVEYLVLKKSVVLNQEYQNYYKEVFQNDKKIIYKKK